MYIHYFREGPLTNSSSSHSFLLLKEGQEPPREITNIRIREETSFGPEWFILTSPDYKAAYAARIVYDNFLRYKVPNYIALIATEAVTGVKLSGDGYVDGHSVPVFPERYEGDGPDEEFVEEFFNFIMKETVVILGGTDNEYPPEGWPEGGKRLLLPEHDYYYPMPTEWTCRKDRKRGFWTLYNRISGTKIRLSFDDPFQEAKPGYATVPEQLDVCITKQCGYGCDFCYMNATPDSEQLDSTIVGYLLEHYTANKIFEVCYGGGDPLSYNHIKIMAPPYGSNLSVSITTRHLPARCANFLRQVRAVGISVSTPLDVRVQTDIYIDIMNKFSVEEWERYTPGVPIPAFHVIVGEKPEKVFRNTLNEIRNSADRIVKSVKWFKDRDSSYRPKLLLLAPRNIGRGKDYKFYDVNWLKHVRESVEFAWNLSVHADSELCARYREELEELGGSKLCLVPEDGRYSAYIGFNGKDLYMSPSSFSDIKVPFPRYRYGDPYIIEEAFKRIHEIMHARGELED